MSFGVTFKNNNGSVTISADRYGLVYIGEATFTNTLAPDSFSQVGSGGTGGYIAGSGQPFYIYQITSAVPPVAFIELLTYPYRIASIANTSGNIWQITVGGTSWTTPPKVKCFAKLQGAGAAGWGLRLWDSSGAQRMWDTTEKMLVLTRRDDWAAASNTTNATITQSVSISGFTSPFVMSIAEANTTADRGSATAVGGYYTNTELISGWMTDSGKTTLQRGSSDIQQDQYKDDLAANNNSLPTDRTYLIEGANYT